MSSDWEHLLALCRQAGALLQARGLMCAFAESCTGGLIGYAMTEIPGSSAYFAGSAVPYSYPAKMRVLGVNPDTLAQCGAVSAETAAEMAQGACRLYAADVAVSVTGIAGPGGALPSKPTGTTFFHLSAVDGVERGAHVVWDQDRSGNKRLSAEFALQMLIAYLDELGVQPSIPDTPA